MPVMRIWIFLYKGDGLRLIITNRFESHGLVLGQDPTVEMEELDIQNSLQCQGTHGLRAIYDPAEKWQH